MQNARTTTTKQKSSSYLLKPPLRRKFNNFVKLSSRKPLRNGTITLYWQRRGNKHEGRGSGTPNNEARFSRSQSVKRCLNIIIREKARAREIFGYNSWDVFISRENVERVVGIT